MSESRNIGVYAGWENNQKIGILFVEKINGSENASFEYDKEWIDGHRGLILDPSLPCSLYRLYPADKQLFGAFEDCCPDRWGRKLIDRRESLRAINEERHPRKFFETDYLLGVQDLCRTGGLRFRTDERQFLADDAEMPVPPMTAIRELEQISLGYETGKDTRWVERLVEPGSSLGGARPKANVIDPEGNLWIAKFPSRHDTYDVGAWEKVTHDLARQCGISVPQSMVKRYSDLGSTFLVKRFDRYKDGSGTHRIHFASAMTMLGTRDGKTDGIGYLDLAEAAAYISGHTDRNLKELFRRMVFDIAVANQDDHLRNHGFLLKDGRWELSPAYDMNPIPDAEFLSLNIDLDDGYRSFEKALGTHEFYHLEEKEAQEIINHTASVVSSSWKTLARKMRIPDAEQKYMSPAFELSERWAKGHAAVKAQGYTPDRHHIG